MDLASAHENYVTRMLDAAKGGMKALVCDRETVNTLSVVMSQSEVLSREVFLIEQLHENPHEPMRHLKAIVFVRPTRENVRALGGQLRRGIYGEYRVFFSNVCSETLLRELAAEDEDELVVEVQEYYADVVAMEKNAFTLNLGEMNAASTRPERFSRGGGAAVDRCVEGISSVLLALKRRPFVRHQRSSESARRLAGDVARLVYEQEAGLFDFRRRDEGSTHVLILDRFDDAVTPLLSQWTYQAMVHEIFGISCTNRVDLTHVRSLSKDLRELVLSAREDRFFADNMYANYGDLGASVKALVDEFQQQTKMNKKIESIDDMTRFVESYPEFRAKSGNVSKHVALMSELSAVIERRRLMAASQVEQEIVCGTDRAGAFAQVVDALQNPSIMEEERLKLVLLFALRYEGETTRVADLTEILMRQGVSRRRVGLVRTILTLAGEKARTGATMAAIVAPVAVLAPRAVAPKARATRALRATTFNGVKVAQPKLALKRSVSVKAVADSKINTDEVLKTIADKWEDTENKSAVVTYVAGAAALVWLSGTVVGAINSIPVLPKVMELVGLGYSSWFVYRYVLFKDSRKELVEQFDALKNKVSGEL